MTMIIYCVRIKKLRVQVQIKQNCYNAEKVLRFIAPSGEQELTNIKSQLILVLGDLAKKKTMRFDSIRFHSMKLFSFFLNPFASPYGFVNNGYADSCI